MLRVTISNSYRESTIHTSDCPYGFMSQDRSVEEHQTLLSALRAVLKPGMRVLLCGACFTRPSALLVTLTDVCVGFDIIPIERLWQTG